jgi:hypothetical protein
VTLDATQVCQRSLWRQIATRKLQSLPPEFDTKLQFPVFSRRKPQ